MFDKEKYLKDVFCVLWIFLYSKDSMFFAAKQDLCIIENLDPSRHLIYEDLFELEKKKKNSGLQKETTCIECLFVSPLSLCPLGKCPTCIDHSLGVTQATDFDTKLLINDKSKTYFSYFLQL